MKYLRIFALLALAVLIPIAMTGCPPTPVTLKTVTLSPDAIDPPYQYHYSQSWECSVPLPGQGLFINGLGPEPVMPGETTVGWEDIYNEGAQPLPCEEEQQTIYRGHIHFNVSQFDAIVDATLTYDTSHSENTTGGRDEVPPNSYATTLGMSTGTRDDGNGPYFWDYDNDVLIGACGILIQPNCSVDVSYQANQWASQKHFNWGFIIAGPKFSTDNPLPKDNNAQLTWYRNFKLTIMYNPALNPRAPQ
jgi:hypothetical protein